jgi:hypothetical protein
MDKAETQMQTVRLHGRPAVLTSGPHAGMRHALYGTYIVVERDYWGEPRIVRSTHLKDEWELTR